MPRNEPISLNDLDQAIAWLDINEDEDGGCQRVANMLRKLQSRRIEESAIRSAAKQAGVTVRVARRHIKRLTK